MIAGQVTGLDPAGPLYDTNLDGKYQISPSSAIFVDAYHTNRGELGQLQMNAGTIDVFVNGGNLQPGCETDDLTPIPG